MRSHFTMSVWIKLSCTVAIWGGLAAWGKAAEPVRYARFQVGDQISYGLVEGDRVRALEGDLFGQWKKTDRTHALSEVKLLVPCQPKNVYAMAGNYRSHLTKGATTTTVTTTTVFTFDPQSGKNETSTSSKQETRIPGQVPPIFQIPQPFIKLVSCLTAHDTPIIIPKTSTGDVHYEAEMVVVIGREAKKVSVEEAPKYVFGVTCGNDVSERTWQKADVQWWRAKASDTFGPCGPFLVTGLNYDNLQLKLRLNGEVKQDESTAMLIHNVSAMVSFISQYATLHPGDMIFTGTSGITSAMKPGDVVEVELEGVGVLRNTVVAEK